ncbi:MAG TPA: RluA family pseudouridine synthase [Micavibrio sp.]|nr:RluA family pseudouridine synthase [Micavibrio sp.]HIL29255.1 RluA family pseudouridine synthase [Micavibrio sp.]
MSDVREVVVNGADDGQRLDRWLKKNVPELPYALAQKLIRKGAIKVNGKKAKTDTRLATGEIVRLPPMEDKPKAPSYRVSPDDEKLIKSCVIFDDGDLVILNKPAGLATQGGGDEKRHIDGMVSVLTNKEGIAPRLVHRLDKETSGVLVLARSPEAVRRLGKMFQGRDIRKLYWAVTLGVPAQREGEIRAPIGKTKGPIKDKMIIDDEDGKHAITDFVVVDKVQGQSAFVAFMPRTGRTHQIRVHASEILECPIVGDSRYHGKGEKWGEMEQLTLANRLHLHARRLVFNHPITDSPLDVWADLPKDLVKSWKTLGFNPSEKIDPFEELF